jgi:hypothetical protein
MKRFAVILLLTTAVLTAQLRVVGTEVLDLGKDALLPRFSADGEYILYGAPDGLYTYEIRNGISLRFAESGYDPVMDEAGVIRYRTDNYERGRRTSSVAVYDSRTQKHEFLLRDIRPDAMPKITDHGVYYVEKSRIKTEALRSSRPSRPVAFVLGNSVVLYSYGTSRILQPAGDRPHIWPSVSPQGDKLCVVGGNDMYVTDLSGKVLFTIEDARAPQWSPDGSRIAFMRDTDDGHVITGSDIYVVRADGSELTRLTATEEHYEMYPQWSPDGRQIICDNPANGRPVLLTLETR